MANKIQLKRGLKSKLPTLSSGEPAYTTDTRELYVGTGSGNVNMGGSLWYTGTAMSGTSTSTTYYYSACPLVKLGDMYLNTTSGNIYQCTTAGSGTTARWTYKGNIKGATGATGPQGPAGANGTNANVTALLNTIAAVGNFDIRTAPDDIYSNQLCLPDITASQAAGKVIYAETASDWYDCIEGKTGNTSGWPLGATINAGEKAIIKINTTTTATVLASW